MSDYRLLKMDFSPWSHFCTAMSYSLFRSSRYITTTLSVMKCYEFMRFCSGSCKLHAKYSSQNYDCVQNTQLINEFPVFSITQRFSTVFPNLSEIDLCTFTSYSCKIHFNIILSFTLTTLWIADILCWLLE